MFDWKQYHALGIWLADNPSACGLEEAALRSAVSRFYYGAYRFVRRHCEERASYSPSNTGNDHSALRRHLKSRNKHLMAQHLADLQIWRERCDYDDEVENLTDLVENARETAGELHRLV